ncbi:Nif3-like dinuclear metal center hexameric protein, partial [Fusobacterium simiae]
MKARDIINILEKKFPKINAEEWDNVGLLIGDYDKEVKKIQFSLDATLESIENAVSKKVDMLITHHPIIFKAIKDINEQNILGKKIRNLIKNDINVYSIHTNLDSSIDGLNDYILSKLGYSEYKILDFNEEKNCGIG